jgi:hypothetical protein
MVCCGAKSGKKLNLSGLIPRRLRRKADCKSASFELGVDTSWLAARFFITCAQRTQHHLLFIPLCAASISRKQAEV